MEKEAAVAAAAAAERGGARRQGEGNWDLGAETAGPEREEEADRWERVGLERSQPHSP
jgi:hypothetical protein